MWARRLALARAVESGYSGSGKRWQITAAGAVDPSCERFLLLLLQVLICRLASLGAGRRGRRLVVDVGVLFSRRPRTQGIAGYHCLGHFFAIQQAQVYC